MRRRDFVAMAGAAMAAPAFSRPLAAAPIPDFSGVWSHPFLTGFEPPASGPGPVTNLSRRPSGVENFEQLVGNWHNPILKPEAARIVKAHGDLSLAGNGYPTPSNQCWPGGVPYVFWDFLIQILQAAHEVTIVYRQGEETRRIRMNEAHPAHPTPSWYGDSVGHYEGDTLLIDTISVKHGPYAMLDMFGTPFSDRLHVVERYRLIPYLEAKAAIERNARENSHAGGGWDFDPNYRGRCLQLAFTVEDPEVFTEPWTATITYRPAIYGWIELICAENPREFDGAETPVPTAKRPDF
jgi:hypothetical protein